MIRRTCLKTFRSDESVLLEVKQGTVTPFLTSFSVATNKGSKSSLFKPYFNGRFYVESNERHNEMTSNKPIFLYASATTDGRNDLSPQQIKMV